MTENLTRPERRRIERKYLKPATKADVGDYLYAMQQGIDKHLLAVQVELDAVYSVLKQLGATDEQIEQAREEAAKSMIAKLQVTK